MSKKDFDDFIEKQTLDQQKNNPVNWDKKREEWLAYLEQFYQLIKGFLKEYEHEGKVSCTRSKKEIFEEYIGAYTVNVLNISIAGQKLKIKPIGTNIIGAKGRVDLIGAKGTVKFVLVDKEATAPTFKVNIRIHGEEYNDGNIKEPEIKDWAWKIATPPPGMSYIELEQDSFLSAVMEVING